MNYEQFLGRLCDVAKCNEKASIVIRTPSISDDFILYCYEHYEEMLGTPSEFRIISGGSSKSEAMKHDDGKLKYDLLPPKALAELVKLYTFGTKKYDDRNWELGSNYSRWIDAFYRHVEAFRQGEDIDNESRCHHLAAAAFNCLALLEFCLTGNGKDDRRKYKDETIEKLKTTRIFGPEFEKKLFGNVPPVGTTVEHFSTTHTPEEKKEYDNIINGIKALQEAGFSTQEATFSDGAVMVTHTDPDLAPHIKGDFCPICSQRQQMNVEDDRCV